MQCIYTPKGRAREYSPKALNIYLQCSHQCDYCYCKRLRGDSFYGKPEPRKNLISFLRKELEKEKVTEQVLLSFIGDVYCEAQDDNQATHDVLEILRSSKVPTAVLTKGGKRAMKDAALFKEFGEHFQIGTTLTFIDEADSLEHEPGAALPSERLLMLNDLHDMGIRTFASFEPVIDPVQSLQLIRESLGFVDVFKVGKINNYKGIDKTIDWERFLSEAVDILRSNKKAFYVKQDLRQAAPSVKLYGNECIPDEHNVR